MALRSTWSGQIQFGLVSVSVKLYAAVEDGAVRFHNLHATCGSAVKMDRKCPVCDIPLSEGEMVKGYEVAKDTFVRVEADEIEALKAGLKGAKAIEVLAFVEDDTLELKLDTRFFDAPYFVGCDIKTGGRPFALLHAGMTATGLQAFVRIVMREKEHLGVLYPVENGMMLWTLRWADEIRESEEAFASPLAHVTEAETGLAIQLINQLRGSLDLGAYQDNYKAAVLRLVEAKQMGTVIEFPRLAIAAPLDLMAALQASLSTTAPALPAPAEKPTAIAKARKPKAA